MKAVQRRISITELASDTLGITWVARSGRSHYTVRYKDSPSANRVKLLGTTWHLEGRGRLRETGPQAMTLFMQEA